jgi:hypothetical protein
MGAALKSPGKTTLFRMQQTAQSEQARIELSLDRAPYLERKRDDFAGIVRLIDAILSDQEMINRLKARMGAQAMLATDIDVEVAD